MGPQEILSLYFFYDPVLTGCSMCILNRSAFFAIKSNLRSGFCVYHGMYVWNSFIRVARH